MRIDIITIFPEMFVGPFTESIIKRAVEKKIVDIHTHNLRDYSTDRHKRVDDYPFAAGAGMVMMVEPVDNCISKLKSEREYDEVIYMSPDGELLNQSMANTMSMLNNIIVLCGHYKGIDERIRKYLITKEISIGDYVLSGGELGAAVLVDSLVRLIPGALGDETSALSDSFQDGLVSPPVYTRPRNYKGWQVPDVLISGNDRLINEWKYEQALARTKERRPEMYEIFKKNENV
ncbi:MAG: tRNA (guanosine(37)-N1)-methyltransferase TrmD [Bacteroidales bacterium]|nr:tRNA (guanosine(37)-N1)-methyltransferase TrmD [Bacteroidales bacterium]